MVSDCRELSCDGIWLDGESRRQRDEDSVFVSDYRGLRNNNRRPTHDRRRLVSNRHGMVSDGGELADGNRGLRNSDRRPINYS